MNSSDTKKNHRISHWNKDSDSEHDSEIVIGKGMSSQDFLNILSSTNAKHVISQEASFVDTAIDSSLQILEAPHSIFNFPLATILTPKKIDRESEKAVTYLDIAFNDTSQKNKIMAQFFKKLKHLKISETLAHKVVLAADELFTNALYNAPTVGNEAVSRNQPVMIKNDLKCHIKLGISNKRLAVVCSDPFGSLDTKEFINHIRSCFKKHSMAKINFEQSGGAGIGSFLIYNLCMSHYIGVLENQKTVIGAVFSTDRKQYTQSEGPKSIHLT